MYQYDKIIAAFDRIGTKNLNKLANVPRDKDTLKKNIKDIFSQSTYYRLRNKYSLGQLNLELVCHDLEKYQLVRDYADQVQKIINKSLNYCESINQDNSLYEIGAIFLAIYVRWTPVIHTSPNNSTDYFNLKNSLTSGVWDLSTYDIKELAPIQNGNTSKSLRTPLFNFFYLRYLEARDGYDDGLESYHQTYDSEVDFNYQHIWQEDFYGKDPSTRWRKWCNGHTIPDETFFFNPVQYRQALFDNERKTSILRFYTTMIIQKLWNFHASHHNTKNLADFFKQLMHVEYKHEMRR